MIRQLQVAAIAFRCQYHLHTFYFQQHSSGLETLVSIGAVDFLSHLRRDVDPSLYQYIDDVLTNLLSLPEVLDSDDEQLHYDREKHTNDLIDLDVKSADAELLHKKVGAEIEHAKEEHSIPAQKSVDKIQTIPAGQEWHTGEGIGMLQYIYFTDHQILGGQNYVNFRTVYSYGKKIIYFYIFYIFFPDNYKRLCASF